MLRQAIVDWNDDGAPRLGAALSYYTIVALAPLLVLMLAVASMLFGREAAQGRLLEQAGALVGPVAAEAIETMLANAREPKQGVLATAFGLVTLLLGASAVFNELKASLNTVWEAPPPPRRGLLRLLRERLASFAMLLVVGFLLLISLTLSALLAALTDGLRGFVGDAALFQALDVLVSLVVVTALFAMMFKLLPDADPPPTWRDVWAGAAATALLFTVGKYAIGLYLGRGTIGSAYGAAGSLAILLVWVYYAAQIFLFGAELTQVFSWELGSRAALQTKPRPAAVAGGPPPIPHERRVTRIVEPENRSIGQLLRDLKAQVKDVLAKQVALARTEMSERLRSVIIRASAVALSSAILLVAAIALMQAVISAATVLLGRVLPGEVAVWLGPLLVGAILGGLGWLKLRRDVRSFKALGLGPEETVDAMRETTEWMRTGGR